MAASKNRPVSVPDWQLPFVEEAVRSGEFASASDVVCEALLVLERDRWEREAKPYLPYVQKWLETGELTEEDAAALPRGFVERMKAHFEFAMEAGHQSGDGGEFDRARLDAIIEAESHRRRAKKSA